MMADVTAQPLFETSGSSLMAWMAWRRYLTTTRAADGKSYAAVEESAWERLGEELAAGGRPLSDDVPVRVLA
jgi:hypothetical protein